MSTATLIVRKAFYAVGCLPNDVFTVKRKTFRAVKAYWDFGKLSGEIRLAELQKDLDSYGIEYSIKPRESKRFFVPSYVTVYLPL